jgi:hypothetical protein
MIRVTVRLLVLGLLLAFTGIAWWYFTELLQRTNFASQRTSLGNGTIWIMYGTCFVAVLLGIYVQVGRSVPRLPASILLVAALIPMIGFAYLNVSGTVCWITKDCDCVPLLRISCLDDDASP